MFERLFGGKTQDPAIAARIPPGQYRTEKFPVLHYGSVPKTDLATWDFKVFGEVDSPFSLTWTEFKALPRKTVQTDIHCVTRWTKLDTTWEGVPIQEILSRAQLRPAATVRARPLRAGLHRQPAAVDPRRRRRPPGRHVRRRAARARARLAAPAARPEALLLEERQVDPRPGVPRPRHPRLLGALRLQQRRRPLEGRALLRVAWPAAWPRPRSLHEHSWGCSGPNMSREAALSSPNVTRTTQPAADLLKFRPCAGSSLGHTGVDGSLPLGMLMERALRSSRSVNRPRARRLGRMSPPDAVCRGILALEPV